MIFFVLRSNFGKSTHDTKKVSIIMLDKVMAETEICSSEILYIAMTFFEVPLKNSQKNAR